MNLSSLVSTSLSRLSGFDYFVLAGALVNLLVIGLLIGFWLISD